MAGSGIGRTAVIGLAATALVAGSAMAVSSGGGDAPGKAAISPASAGGSPAAQTATTVLRGRRGPRGFRGYRGVRGLRGLPGAIGAAGATGATGPSEATAVLDSTASPFVNILATDTTIASKGSAAGAYVILAKTGLNGGTTGGRIVCNLLAGVTELDQSIAILGNDAGAISQTTITLMSAVTLAAPATITIVCHKEGGAGTTFASHQQILTIKAGSAATTAVTF